MIEEEEKAERLQLQEGLEDEEDGEYPFPTPAEMDAEDSEEDSQEDSQEEEEPRVLGQRPRESFADFLFGDPEPKKSKGEEDDVLVDFLREKDASCIVIKVDGTIEKVDGPWKSRKRGYLDLAECYKLLNCEMIQLVPCRFEVPEGKYEMIMDEEGRLNGAESNLAAASILGTQLGQVMAPMFGDVILCKAGALA